MLDSKSEEGGGRRKGVLGRGSDAERRVTREGKGKEKYVCL